MPPVSARPRLVAPAALLVVLLLASALPALTSPARAAGNPEQARIAQTRSQLAAVRSELDSARGDMEAEQIALEDADRQLQAAFDAVEAARQAVQRQQDAVADAEQRLAEAQAALAAQRELMGQRVAQMYRQARPDDVLAVLGASTVTEAIQQGAYMSAIGRQDRAAVETLGNLEATVEAEERALELETVALGEVLDEQEALLADVEEIRNDQAVIAAASEELVAQLESRESHLEEEQAELERIAAQRAAAEAAAAAAAAAAARPVASAGGSGGAAAGGGSDDAASGGGSAPAPAPPAPSGGGFSWPTSGSVTSEFGPRWGRMHEGIDIANGTGTAVAAAKGGTVVQAGTMGGYGNVVMVAHGGGFTTVYAHLSSIAVSNGQSVSTGTYLGGMGCTGSCTGTHLHFEIRANGTPVNPRSYL